jgi:hypothetical protein
MYVCWVCLARDRMCGEHGNETYVSVEGGWLLYSVIVAGVGVDVFLPC